MKPRRQARGLLGERLDFLLNHVRAPDGQRYTLEGLADELNDRGVSCSRHYIGALRTGDRTNPTIDVLRAIADVFGVSVDVFIRPDSPEFTQLEKLVEIRDGLDRQQMQQGVADAAALSALPQTDQVFLRSWRQLDAAGQAALMQLISSLTKPTPPTGETPAGPASGAPRSE